MDPADTGPIESPKNQKPSTVKEVRYLVCLLGYYRKYVSDFSRIAKPLYDCRSPRKRVPDEKDKTYKTAQRLSREIVDRKEHIKECCVTSMVSLPVQRYLLAPTLKNLLPFILMPPKTGWGAVAILYQAQDGGNSEVNTYWSMTFTPAKQKHYLHFGKFLVVK